MRQGAIAAMIAVLLWPALAAAQDRSLPYWASITAGDALMRAGPGRNFPAVWRYRRADLPVQVVQMHESWRKVREIDGTEGWMAAALLSLRRTAIVTGQGFTPMNAAPGGGGSVLWRAEPGVIGHIAHCAAGWCEFDVRGRVGYVETARLWGVTPGEVVP